MRRVVVLILLALTSVSLLTGCLVHKKKQDRIYRTTDKLRVYQPGDYIDYYVTSTSYADGSITTPTTNSGTLLVKWESNPDLIRPDTASPSIPVLKETSTLSINGSDHALVRYISQDSGGQITLHAVEDFSGNMDWLSASDIIAAGTPSGANTLSYIVFYSDSTAVPPGIQFGTMPAISFHIIEGCGPGNGTDGTCDSHVAQYNDSMTVVGDTTTVTTNLGIFENPFQIDFNGSINSYAAANNLFAFTDIRDICATGDNGSSTEHGYGGNGTMYVMPQVGMVQMQNTCHEVSTTGTTTTYTITIRSTNIPLN